MKNNKVYKQAREYAAEEYSPDQKEYWLIVSSFLEGYAAANKEEPFEVEVKAIRFYFPGRKIEIPLKNPVKVLDKKSFILELRRITKAKGIALC